ncbi:hypothetical protein GRS48_12140 [Halorubrum sp. JWXQ-INN 858]|uniref:hypothetical protein n=1 Tax=Halorubrum sp. JWXQ-INN 858 TaxID=2690782 RepID=UPI0013FC862F|nr:hypothetical protein [Halorubrum sp. JWXQ-INN 858]MWV65563.1 hypothetical protein [Halorubrum sp. JWXQ-INN 858]
MPRGDLLRSRVVSDASTPLSTALDRELTGYATIVPQATLLLSAEARGVITFADGVPVLAYNTVTDNGGADALAELAVPGPHRVELYAVDAAALDAAHEADALRVTPGSVATELADDPALADRTREAAPDDRATADDGDDADAVAAFLEDDDRIAAIREQAREEARTRAAEWGFDDALADDAVVDDSGGDGVLANDSGGDGVLEDGSERDQPADRF